MSSLRDRTISGIFWSFLQKVGSSGIQFVTTIILARILTPKDFGLIAMLAVFIELSQILITAGFGDALIQKKDTDAEDYSAVFYINLVVSIVLYGILYFTAPLIAAFYHQPVLIDLTRALSVVFVINAFSFVQENRLIKKMNFKTLTIIHIPAIIVGGIVSIGMAMLDYGVWSLIALQLTYRFVYAVQIWIYSRWKPLLAFNGQRARKLFSFGSKIMISSALNALFGNAFVVIIGKYFPIVTLGFYQNARNMIKAPSSILSGVLTSVTFSAFSSIQNDNKRLKAGYRKSIQQLVFWMCPAFILAGVLATPLFRFVFTEKWLPAVPYFRLLCIIGILYPLNSYNLSIINVKGRSDLYLKLNVLKKIITIVGIALAIPFGIWALVSFQAANSIIRYIINSHYSGKFIQYPLKEQLKDILPIFILSIVTGALVSLVDYSLFELPDIIRLLAGFGVGIGIYWLIAKIVPFEPYVEIKHIFQEKAQAFFKGERGLMQ